MRLKDNFEAIKLEYENPDNVEQIKFRQENQAAASRQEKIYQTFYDKTYIPVGLKYYAYCGKICGRQIFKG